MKSSSKLADMNGPSILERARAVGGWLYLCICELLPPFSPRLAFAGHGSMPFDSSSLPSSTGLFHMASGEPGGGVGSAGSPAGGGPAGGPAAGTPSGGAGGAPGAPDKGAPPDSGGGDGDASSYTAAQVNSMSNEAVSRSNYAWRDRFVKDGILGRSERLEDVSSIFSRLTTERDSLQAQIKKIQDEGDKGGKGTGDGISKVQMQKLLEEQGRAHETEKTQLTDDNKQLRNTLHRHVVHGEIGVFCEQSDVRALPLAVQNYVDSPSFPYQIQPSEDPTRPSSILEQDGSEAWNAVEKRPKTLKDILLELKADANFQFMFRVEQPGGMEIKTGPGSKGGQPAGGAPLPAGQGTVPVTGKDLIKTGVNKRGWGQGPAQK